MRHRLSPNKRRADILQQSTTLFRQRGYGAVEMEHIREACGISRGGLYHHFENKAAILEGIVQAEIGKLANAFRQCNEPPIQYLLAIGSSHLGAEKGIVTALNTRSEIMLYISFIERAIGAQLAPLLAAKLETTVVSSSEASNIAELFLVINTHINRKALLGDWEEAQSAAFAATALKALQPFLKEPAQLAHIIANFQNKA